MDDIQRNGDIQSNGDGDIHRKLTNSRESKRIEAVMVEPEVKSDSMAPFASEAKPAAMRVLDRKNSVKSNHNLLQPPHLLHPPTHRVGAFIHLGSQTTLGPDHHAETIAVLEAQLQRTQEELTLVKEQLAVSETGKAQAVREYTNIKNLLDQISLVEHFAASDDVEVETAPLPLNWSDGSSAAQLDTDAHLKEVENLRRELEAEKSLNSTFAAELEKAKHEMDEAHHNSEISRKETSRLQSELEAGRNRQGSLSQELENAKKDILSLQATVSDAWSHQGTSALELARAKEEIAWLAADLNAARNLTLDLARAKDNITSLQRDLEVAHRLQETTSTELSEAHDEISRLSSGITDAMLTNTALKAELENLRGLQETSTTELQNAKQDILEIHREHETRIAERDSESANTKEEIRRLQGELTAALTDARGSAIMLKVAEEEMEELQKKLGVMRGQYYNTSAELSEATEQNEKLRSEKETLQLKYESCSSELFNVKEDVFRLEVEHLASHEDLMTDITNAQDENLRLQAEVDTLKDEKITLSVELAKGRDEIKSLQSELETVTKRHYSACSDLFAAKKEISRLQSEFSDCCREIDNLKGVCRNFQMELTQVQELHDVVMAELVNAKKKIEELQLGSTQEFERSLEVVRGLKDEMSKVQGELSMQYSSLVSEKSLTEKQMQELRDTNVQLQEAIDAQKKAENALAESIKEIETRNAELEQIRGELAKAREAESKLQSMAIELEELRSQSVSTALASELSALNTELCAMKNSEANYREIVSSSQAQIEELKTRLYALRDSEAKANERLVSTSSELQKVKIEHAIAKEALEWVGGDAAALSAELEAKNAELEATKDVLEAKRAEVAFTKEGESRAKAAFTDYSLKLQRMKSELEDATKLADKARELKLDLDETMAKLEKVTESEKIMSSSMASLKAELNDARTELEAARENHGITLAEKQQQYELELNQMRREWEVAVMAEAEDASFAVREAAQEAEKAKQEVEDLHAHIETLELKLKTLHLEVEAAKASEEWALAQTRLRAIPEYDMETEEEGVDAPVSFEEYRNLKMKAKKLQELVNKRVAVGVAEVNAAKASEKETHRRLQTLEKELQSLRTELTEAINKREEAEAAKFACETTLRSKRLNHNKSLSDSGHLNGAHPSGKLVNPGDRQGSLNGVCFEDSLESSSSPSRSSFSFASFASPGRSEKSPMESVVAQAPSEESSKQRKLKFSSKIGDYFRKKKVLV